MKVWTRRTVLRSLSFLLGLQMGACGDRRKPSPMATAQSGAEAESLAKSALTESSLEQRWIVTAAEAKQLIDQGATLLDAQGGGIGVTRLRGAQPVRWDQFTPDDAVNRGRLLEDDQALEQKLRALGLSHSKPVVVFGNPPKGWGEEGRMVWMLRTLGHRQAVLVDGGVVALQDVGVSKGKPPQASETVLEQLGDFVVQRTDEWDIQQDELQQQIAVAGSVSSGVDSEASAALNADSNRVDSNAVLLIDTRELREYGGETPYGEQRGGHVPGAVHLYFKDLLNAEGMLLPEPEIRQKLAALGVTVEAEIVAYCTGGIRSGWLTAVLTDLGYSARNYAGSMWEWSAGEGDRYPLVSE